MLRFLFFVYMDKINNMEENPFFKPGIIFFLWKLFNIEGRHLYNEYECEKFIVNYKSF